MIAPVEPALPTGHPGGMPLVRDIQEAVYAYIERARARDGRFSHEDFAKLAGMTPSELSRALNAGKATSTRRAFSIETAEQLARALGGRVTLVLDEAEKGRKA